MGASTSSSTPSPTCSSPRPGRYGGRRSACCVAAAPCSPASSTPRSTSSTSSSPTRRARSGSGTPCRIPMRRAGAKKSWVGRWREESRSSSATRWRSRSGARRRPVSCSPASTRTVIATIPSPPSCRPSSPPGRSNRNKQEEPVAKPVTMPQLGESVTEGTITRWLKAEGEEVEIDEPLAEVDTDKVNAELPSPVAGTIEKFLVSEGSTVDVGTEILLVAGESDSPAADAPPQENTAADAPTEDQPAAQDTERQRAVARADSDGDGRGEIEDAETLRLTRSSPVVRRLAEEHDVEITEIPGTGTGGRVTRKDIEGYIEEQEGRRAERETFAEPERLPLYEGDRVKDLSSIRRTI